MEGDSTSGIITFDRAGIDKLVCHDGLRQTWNDGEKHHLLHDPNYFRIILPPIYYASGTAERVSPIPTFLRNLSLSLCLILESVGK